MFNVLDYVTKSTVLALGRDKWDKFRRTIRSTMDTHPDYFDKYGHYDTCLSYDYVVISVGDRRGRVFLEGTNISRGKEITLPQILNFIGEGSMNLSDIVNIQVSVQELARIYAKMGCVNGNISPGDSVYFIAQEYFKDDGGEKWKQFSEKHYNCSYISYQKEWEALLLSQESAEEKELRLKKEKLQQIIEDARKQLEELS